MILNKLIKKREFHLRKKLNHENNNSCRKKIKIYVGITHTNLAYIKFLFLLISMNNNNNNSFKLDH